VESSRDPDAPCRHGNGRSLRQIVDEALSGGGGLRFDHGVYVHIRIIYLFFTDFDRRK
jgi:hypothetical protein